jgi:hypothetical protein
MEDQEMKSLWRKYDEQFAETKLLNTQAWVVNLQTIDYLQKYKSQRTLNALSRFKGFAVALGLLWAGFLAYLAYHVWTINLFFSVSAIAITFFTLLACAAYLRQIFLIREINMTAAVVDAQQKIETLRTSTIKTTRILMLQIPFYTTWFWHPGWIDTNLLNFCLISVPVTGLLTALSCWLYQNIRLENADKKWFRWLFASTEYTAILEARAHLRKIEEFAGG